METIKNYLDTMFANLPSNPAVLKAKEVLWEMMEDKYNELIASGRTENEAVGTVISEFGNLQELADALGLEDEMNVSERTVEESKKDNTITEDAKTVSVENENAASKESMADDTNESAKDSAGELRRHPMAP